MTQNDLIEMYLEHSTCVDAPFYTMKLTELKNLRLSLTEANHLDDMEVIADLNQIIDTMIKFRSMDWPNLYEETRKLLEIATNNKLYAATLSHSIGAGLAVVWNPQRLFSLAEENRFHFELALKEASSILRLSALDPHYEIPQEVILFASKVLDGTIARPKSRGPHQLQYFGRDQKVEDMINLAVKNGLKRYRNEATKERKSAFDLVAEICAPTEMGVKNYGTVKKIWQNRTKRREEFKTYFHPCNDQK